MEILSVNVESRLANVASAVGRNPRSWAGWTCLMIDISRLDEEAQGESMIWCKSIIDSYLKDVEGRAYFWQGDSMHIFSKNIPHNVIYQAGAQVCEMIKSETGDISGFDLFDLFGDGIFYAQHVLEKIRGVRYVTVSTAGLEDLFEKGLPEDHLAANAPQPKKRPEMVDLKILLVEDDPVTRWMVRSALKDHCCFACAPSAGKAIAMYESYRPHVIFLDIGLPDQNGRDVLTWILQRDPEACVVMFSANSHLDNIAGALEDGASGFIAKPFLKEQLLHYLKTYQAN